jgi:hypothetical protein
LVETDDVDLVTANVAVVVVGAVAIGDRRERCADLSGGTGRRKRPQFCEPLAFRQLPVPLAHDVWLIVVVTCAAAGLGAKSITASTAATNTSEARRQFESFLVTNVSFLFWFAEDGK